MEARGFSGSKKVVTKYVPIVTKKKFTAPTFVDRAKPRNFQQVNLEPEVALVKKPFRMNSVNKPSRGHPNQINYALNGINYFKKRDEDQYDYSLEEESKAIPKQSAKFGLKITNPVQHYPKEWNNDDDSSEFDYEAQVKLLAQKVEELEKKLKAKDVEINRIKLHNKRLSSEKNMIEAKLKKMIREDRQKEMERMAQQQQIEAEGEEDAEGDQEPMDNNALQKHLLSMLMQAQAYDQRMQMEYEAQREQEMIEKAIQESLKENPNPDVMNYEQLQELEEKIGYVSKGFTDKQISQIPTKTCTSTKEDCSICLEQVKVGEQYKALSCGHEFHKECIDQCLKTTKKCPCCMHEHEILSM